VSPILDGLPTTDMQLTRTTSASNPQLPIPNSQLPTCDVVALGVVRYADALALQRRLCEARSNGGMPDMLLLLEHQPVFTLGRRGSHADILASPDRLAELGIEVHETNRGGLVTYHGPGQLVGYPITDLRRLAGDAPRYVTGLEEVIIRALAEHGIAGFRDEAARGVWTVGGKIAAIGVAVSRGITMHGFAANLQPDMSHFGLIDPCGLGLRGVTSAERLLGRPIDMDGFRSAVGFHFGRVFGREMIWRDRETARATAAPSSTPHHW
jgi:lipoate-protein ligase B